MDSPVRTFEPRHGFYVLGGGCFGLGVLHLLIEGGELGAVLEAAMICGLSTVVLHTGYRLPERPISRQGRRRAVLLGVGIAGSFALLALAVWLTWYLEGLRIKLGFLLSFAASLGAAVGSRSGLYAVQSEEQLTRTRELAKLLKINQRVLRHNLRNELSVALGHLELIETADEPADATENIETIRRHLESLEETSDRAQRIVSIWETDVTREFELATLLEEQVASMREEHPTSSVTIEASEACSVIAHPELPTAIAEALRNAVTHNPSDVTITATLTREDGTAVVEITDTGGGIPETDRDALGLPEETELSHSEGLGLWMIYWIVRKSGGEVSLCDAADSGAVVRITLPVKSRSRFSF